MNTGDKTLSEMSLSEKVDWAAGSLIIAIGRGDFRGVLCSILLGISQEAYDRGVRVGMAAARKEE